MRATIIKQPSVVNIYIDQYGDVSIYLIMDFKESTTFYECQSERRRQFVKSLIQAGTFEEKFVLTKSALFNTKSHHLPPAIKGFMQDRNRQMTNGGLIRRNIISQAQNIESQEERSHKVDPIGQLKQTSQTGCQTETNPQNQDILQRSKFTCSFEEIELTQSKVSEYTFTRDKMLMEESIDTCCSVPLQNDQKANFMKKKQEQQDQEDRIAELTKQIMMLNEKIHATEQQKNKWKRKALKHSNRLKEASKQMDRFEQAFTDGNTKN